MDEEGWSFQTRGNRASTERKNLLLNPTATSAKHVSTKPHSSNAAAKNSQKGVMSPKIPHHKTAATHAVKSVAGINGIVGTTSPPQKKEKKVNEYSIAEASSEAFPALGAAVVKKPPAVASARARLQDVGVKKGSDPTAAGGNSGTLVNAAHYAAPTAASKRSKKVTLFDMILKGNSGGARATSKPAAQKLPLKSTIEVVSAKHVARKKKKRSTKLKKKLLNVL